MKSVKVIRKLVIPKVPTPHAQLKTADQVEQELAKVKVIFGKKKI